MRTLWLLSVLLWSAAARNLSCPEVRHLDWTCDPAACAVPNAPNVMHLEACDRIGNQIIGFQRAFVHAVKHGCTVMLHPDAAVQAAFQPCTCLVPVLRRPRQTPGAQCGNQPRGFWMWMFQEPPRARMQRLTTTAIRLFLGITNTSVLNMTCDYGPRHLTIKVRSGDLMNGTWVDGRWRSEGGVHAGYAQPPLQFYVDVLAHEPWESVLILSEDSNNPVLPVLRQLPALLRAKVRFEVGLPLADVIRHMGCSQNIAQSMGTMGLAWRFSPHIRREFRFVFQSQQDRVGCDPCNPRTEVLFRSQEPWYFISHRKGAQPLAPGSRLDWYNSGENRYRMLLPQVLNVTVCPSRLSASG